jgi:para-aminobenzoate synthetase component 1
MISDLLRNDLGIVCRPGSVEIKSKQNTTKLKKVIHTYSHIVGELVPEVSSIEALLSIFPGGSISGCPKKRALEIIDELEDYSRGPYTGSLFTLDPVGNLESNILIRTLIKEGDKISLPIGGGIVFDSKSHSEYQETLDKSHSIIKTFRS